MLWKSLMKAREVVGNVLMDTIEEDGSLSPTIPIVLQLSSKVFAFLLFFFLFKKIVFLDPIDLRVPKHHLVNCR